MRVLIVDDNAQEAEVLKKLLKRRFDATVFQAGTMREARNIISANNLDCMIMDLQLPDSGIEETIREIKTLPYPVFVYTGFDDPGLRERVLDSRAEDFIVKSTSGTSIVERISHLQYKRTGDKSLLKAAYQTRHDEPREAARSEWKGTIPRIAASIIGVLMFVSGLFTGTWALGKIFGQSAAMQQDHFLKLDQTVIELREAGKSRDAAIKELTDKAIVSVTDREAIRTLMKTQNDLIIDWLKRIEGKLDNRKTNL